MAMVTTRSVKITAEIRAREPRQGHVVGSVATEPLTMGCADSLECSAEGWMFYPAFGGHAMWRTVFTR